MFMDELDAVLRDQDEGLKQLFEAGLALTLQVQDDAMRAETPEARARLAVAFHRLSRGVRQTAALRAKLFHDRQRAAREAQVHADTRRNADIAARKSAISNSVERLIETGVEDEDEQLDAYEDLATRLETESLSDDFLDLPVPLQIARLCQALGLTVAEEASPARPPESGDPGAVPASPVAGPVAAPWAPDDLDFDAAPPLRPSG